MPKVTGVFDYFKNVDQIPAEDIARWISPLPNIIILQNFIANRLSYPQAIPIDQEGLDIDLAILREVLRRDKKYVNATSKKILIPKHFEIRFVDLAKLVWAFVDAYLLVGIWTVVLKGDYDETVGSIIVPRLNPNGQGDFVINNKQVSLLKGGLLVVPCNRLKCVISFNLNGGELLEKKQNKLEIFGGRLGVLIDGRR